MKNVVAIVIILLLSGFSVFAQVGINTDSSTPDPSAGLDVKYNNKGFLIPRLTLDQRNGITSPAEGLMVYCTDCGTNGALSIYSNGTWRTFAPCSAPSSFAGTNILSPGMIIWNWTAVASAAGYKWSTTGSYGLAMDMGTATSKTETGTLCNTTYTRYVWSYNNCGVSEPVILSQTVPANSPAAPATNTHHSAQTSIVWNWNPVIATTGYRWNFINDYATAIDMGTITTKSETGLTCGTVYHRYVWSYNGCGYSTPVTLTQSTFDCCGVPFTDSRDGKTYNTVLIGTQCWFAQNLNVGKRISNMWDATNNDTIEKYCFYDDNAYCDIFGGLYEWDELMNYSVSSNFNPSGRQGICPSGWHVPSDAEFCQMESFLDETVNCANSGSLGTDAGGKMKETGYTHWASPNTGATNSSGFTALPGGYGLVNDGFNGTTASAYFWSTTEETSEFPWSHNLYNNSAAFNRSTSYRNFLYSSRCVAD